MKTYISKLMLTAFTVLSMQAFAQNPPMGIGNGLTVKEPALPDSVNLNNAFLIGSNSSSTQIVYFLHGLGDDPDAWQKGDEATTVGLIDSSSSNFSSYLFRPGKKVRAFRPSYTQINNMNGAADDFLTEQRTGGLEQMVWLNHFEPRHKSYVIAHSQGGLVARTAIRNMKTKINFPDSLFGGLVTFGSPHGGAAILNNGLPKNKGGKGQIEALAAEMCLSLSADPIKSRVNDFISDRGFLFKTFLAPVVKNIVDTLNKATCTAAGASIPLFLQDKTPNIVHDYKVGANFLEHPTLGLNNYTPVNFPMVAFWGEEEDPTFWRLANSLYKPATDYSLFNANDDSTLIDYKKIRADFKAEYLAYWWQVENIKRSYVCSHNFPYWGILAVFAATYDMICANRLAKPKKMKNAWFKGLRFIDDVNPKWSSIIGARKDTLIQNGYNCTCQLYGDPNNTMSRPVSSPSDCKPVRAYLSNCQSSLNWELKTITKPHDGVVTAKSAKSLPGKTVIPGERYDMKETNHMQMRNNKALKTKLDRLYDGKYGRFFQIPR